MTELTAATLPDAIRTLFELNHYAVDGPIQVRGAEIDLVARPMSDPFGSPIYIEATVEYVDNVKYGKDVGKLAMIAELEPGARRLIVSSKGFSLPVAERAKATRIETLTYQELFRKFERFERYVSTYLGDTEPAAELRRLSELYEEPNFADTHGHEQATAFLTDWKNSKTSLGQWLLVTGEYGTGKTALTKVLQYRWLHEYRANPQLPLPLRIELREFSSQFNARGLLHHFLDHNNLSHIAIDFVLTLIRGGRVILLLDGYDEMAQYLHARERRACLEALAELSTDGARGVLTSRPNYFTEAEELQMFETLYKSLEHGHYVFGAEARKLLDNEERIDRLLQHFIDRYERVLQDLSPAQTETLIRRVLAGDAHGREVVLRILKRIFRSLATGDEIALSGKPVIVSYLLEVVEGLKTSMNPEGVDLLTEWEVYQLIVDQLMLRDFKRAPEIHPQRRQEFLWAAAMFLSRRENPAVSEEDFRDLVAKEFRRDISRHSSQTHYVEQLFSDLRSSATLTRGTLGMSYGWRFSHNSLREYLVAEGLIVGLEDARVVKEPVRISDAMRIFAGSISGDRRQRLVERLSREWGKSENVHGRGQLLTLLWDGLVRWYPKDAGQRGSCLRAIAGDPPDLRKAIVNGLVFSDEVNPTALQNADFSHAELYNVGFSGANLTGANFANATLENVDFSMADLRKSDFRNGIIVESDFSGSDVGGADFRDIDPAGIAILVDWDEPPLRRLLDGFDALGYLGFHGATTDSFRTIYVLQHHPAFPVADKILQKLGQQTQRQRRGLEQRGAARQNVAVAKGFMAHLENHGLVFTPRNRKDLVEVTEEGRKAFSKYASDREFTNELAFFFVEQGS